MMNITLANKLKNLPLLPGCYLMKNKVGKILYVGKAKNLKNRVNSYFHGAHDHKTTKLVSEIADFEIIVTHTETESLILEANLIKQHTPKYNILLKDDKSYPYIKFTYDQLPLLVVSRDKKHVKTAQYFGPYPNAGAARNVVDFINQLYPTQKCFPLRKKVCLYYHMGLCLGPCQYPMDKQITDTMAKEILAILRGDVKEVTEKLVAQMHQASDELQFEKASAIKQQIDHLQYIAQKQFVQTDVKKRMDVFNYYAYQGYLCIVGLLFRQGRMLSRKMVLQPIYEDEISALGSFLMQYYTQNEVPKEVYIPAGLDLDLYSQALSVKVKTASRGEKKQWLDMAMANAKIMLNQRFDELKLKADRYGVAKQELLALLPIQSFDSVELIDVSHTAGEQVVGASVYFEAGKPIKDKYRRFKLNQGNNDLANMQEMMLRKGQRHLKGEWLLADVLIVDGGVNQVKVISKLLSDLGISVPCIGLVKDEKHQTRGLVIEEREIGLDRSSHLYLWLALLQDEVHRFAISYHRQRQLKKMSASFLDEIKGVGPVRKEKLYKHFGAFKNIAKASVAEIQAIVGEKTGEMVYNQLMDIQVREAKSIAVIDSGLGGYTIFHELIKHYPLVSFTFLADQQNAPFGDKTQEQLYAIGKSFCEYCLSHQIVDVIVACNTLSSTVLGQLQSDYPTLNLISIIDATLSMVSPSVNSVQVLATQATVNSGVYGEKLRLQNHLQDVKQTAAVALVGLIESLADDAVIAAELERLVDLSVDCIVLGCTHYPLIKHLIAHPNIVDALSRYDLLMSHCVTFPMGENKIMTTGQEQVLQRQIRELFNEKVDVSRGVL